MDKETLYKFAQAFDVPVHQLKGMVEENRTIILENNTFTDNERAVKYIRINTINNPLDKILKLIDEKK